MKLSYLINKLLSQLKDIINYIKKKGYNEFND